MVIVWEAHAAETPAGNPEGVPIPVAPVVVWVIGVIAVPMQREGEEEASVTVLFGLTIISMSSEAIQPLMSVKL